MTDQQDLIEGASVVSGQETKCSDHRDARGSQQTVTLNIKAFKVYPYINHANYKDVHQI